MRSVFVLLTLATGLGCKDRPSEPGGTPGQLPSGTGGPGAQPASLPTTPVVGTIGSKKFNPDQVTLEGQSLTFRQGKDFFPDLEIRFQLPDRPVAGSGGQLWTFSGDRFENPTLHVTTRQGTELPKTEFVWPKHYTMTLKLTEVTGKSVEGVIDLRTSSPVAAHLAGTFSAVVRRTNEDPLDAGDAPYVEGRIIFVGTWSEAQLSVGFLGRGADGKSYSNMAGTRMNAKGAGGATSLTFDPQRTSLFGTQDGPAYRHTRMAPGDYIIYVRQNDVLAAWKSVVVKAGDQLTLDLSIDPARTGDLAVTLAEEAADLPDGHLSLIPVEVNQKDQELHYAFHAAEVKKGQTQVSVQGVPAGKYWAVRGKSSAVVEVVAGQTTPVTLSGAAPEKN